MNILSYKQDQLFLESTSIEEIANNIATPFYCYSASSIEIAYREYTEQLTNNNAMVCYALKANSNQAIIKTLADLGSGADVVSEGEMRRALLAGIPANKIVYSGVAKTSNEIQFALEQDILQFNVESENELFRLSEVASSMDKTASIAFRINPNVDANTHEKIATGKSENKFGIPISRAREVYKKAANLPGIKIQGVDVHIGSQLTSLSPFRDAFKLIRDLVIALRSDKHNIKIIDLGGGLGIPYQHQTEIPDKQEYCSMVSEIFGELDCRIILEPGRSLVGESGILVSRVIYKKIGEERKFLIIDAAMNDLLRPSMYDAYHGIRSVRYGTEKETYDIVGPVCETGDTFAKNRNINKMKQGDFLVIENAGAYGAAMASTYNTRLIVPEVLVKDDRFALIRPRENYQQLISRDQLADWQIDVKNLA